MKENTEHWAGKLIDMASRPWALKGGMLLLTVTVTSFDKDKLRIALWTILSPIVDAMKGLLFMPILHNQ